MTKEPTRADLADAIGLAAMDQWLGPAVDPHAKLKDTFDPKVVKAIFAAADIAAGELIRAANINPELRANPMPEIKRMATAIVVQVRREQKIQ